MEGGYGNLWAQIFANCYWRANLVWQVISVVLEVELRKHSNSLIWEKNFDTGIKRKEIQNLFSRNCNTSIIDTGQYLVNTELTDNSIQKYTCKFIVSESVYSEIKSQQIIGWHYSIEVKSLQNTITVFIGKWKTNGITKCRCFWFSIFYFLTEHYLDAIFIGKWRKFLDATNWEPYRTQASPVHTTKNFA